MANVMRKWLALVLIMLPGGAGAQTYTPAQGDFVARNFTFKSGETIPELRLHYRTLGKPQRDAQGVVRNAVLIVHGTNGSGAQFLRTQFAPELYGPPTTMPRPRSATSGITRCKARSWSSSV